MKMRWTISIISAMICIFLAACGQSQAALNGTATQSALVGFTTQTAQAPTATFTSSPTATSTATPTTTPTVVPTSTPAPTKNPLAAEFNDGKMVMTYEAFKMLSEIGQGWYSDGLYLAEIILYNAMLEYSLAPDQQVYIHGMRGEDYEALGQYDLAIQDHLQSLDLGIRKPATLNDLCWDYAITGRAEEALPYCEEAALQDPSCAVLDSRGVVYAMLGRYPEALADIQAALQLDEFPSEEMKLQRQEWVTILQAGNNPITPQVLDGQQVEQVSLDMQPQYLGDLKLSYVRHYFEDMGYTFTDTEIEGQAGVVGTFQDGGCNVEIALLGNEQEFKGGSSTILNCSHNDLSSHAMEFTFAFAKDLTEMARGLVWGSADYYYVIEGKPVTDISPTFGGFQFSVARTHLAGEDGIVVSALPAE